MISSLKSLLFVACLLCTASYVPTAQARDQALAAAAAPQQNNVVVPPVKGLRRATENAAPEDIIAAETIDSTARSLDGIIDNEDREDVKNGLSTLAKWLISVFTVIGVLFIIGVCFCCGIMEKCATK